MIIGQLLKTQVERLLSNPGKKVGFSSIVKLSQQSMDTISLILLLKYVTLPFI